jgi:hypothetical protein
MDENKKTALISRVGQLGRYNGGFSPVIIPLVTLEEYFDGAEGKAPCLRNNPETPDNEAVLVTLQLIRQRPQVRDVRMAITDLDSGFVGWPLSDKVVIITSASNDEVISWLPVGFEPDGIWDYDLEYLPSEHIEVPSGHRKLWLWYS